MREQIKNVKQSQEIKIMGDMSGKRILEICEIIDLRITNGVYLHNNIHKYNCGPNTRNLKSITNSYNET